MPTTEVRSGRPHIRKSNIIDKLNSIYVTEVRDTDPLHFARGIAERVNRDKAVTAQVRNHSKAQIMHGLGI